MPIAGVGDTANKTSYQTLAGYLSLVLDAADHTSFVQTLSSRAHVQPL